MDDRSIHMWRYLLILGTVRIATLDTLLLGLSTWYGCIQPDPFLANALEAASSLGVTKILRGQFQLRLVVNMVCSARCVRYYLKTCEILRGESLLRYLQYN